MALVGGRYPKLLFVCSLIDVFAMTLPHSDTARLVLQEPPVWILDQFATAHECAELIKQGSPKLQPSIMSGPGGKQAVGHMGRTSWNALLDKTQNALVRTLTARARHLVRNLTETFLATQAPDAAGVHALREVVRGAVHKLDSEPMQITRYKPNEIYAIHMDEMFHSSQPRVATVILYLDTPQSGGETAFPNIVEQEAGTYTGTTDPALNRVSCKRRSRTCSKKKLDRLRKKEKQEPTGIWLCCCDEIFKVAPRAGQAAVFLPQWRDKKVRDPSDIPHPGVGHVACPVPDGEVKHIAQFWLHNFHSFPSAPQGMPKGELKRRLRENKNDEL